MLFHRDALSIWSAPVDRAPTSSPAAERLSEAVKVATRRGSRCTRPCPPRSVVSGSAAVAGVAIAVRMRAAGRVTAATTRTRAGGLDGSFAGGRKHPTRYGGRSVRGRTDGAGTVTGPGLGSSEKRGGGREGGGA